eukprot:TRINITY_DN12591_c0_g1_i1.p1 TRINITY_DN12591_c0_g1~~TRINITY_DN12591_c0_g1_i1.p1  ORF type:complete len:332 (+),score=57.14 TRINITY_DN12591_c0_g1_i1:31-1026(+)
MNWGVNPIPTHLAHSQLGYTTPHLGSMGQLPIVNQAQNHIYMNPSLAYSANMHHSTSQGLSKKRKMEDVEFTDYEPKATCVDIFKRFKYDSTDRMQLSFADPHPSSPQTPSNPPHSHVQPRKQPDLKSSTDHLMKSLHSILNLSTSSRDPLRNLKDEDEDNMRDEDSTDMRRKRVNLGRKRFFHVDLVGDNLFRWRIVPLVPSLGDTPTQYIAGLAGFGRLTLEAIFPLDFPQSPPFIWVVSPRVTSDLRFVAKGGGICIEELTSLGWNPKIDLLSLFGIIESMAMTCLFNLSSDHEHIRVADGVVLERENTEEEAKIGFTSMIKSRGWAI